MTFSFGLNWQLFLQNCNDERIRIARSSLIEFLGIENLRGKSFLDIGCGSGLFSYGAFQLGAERIVSIDIDPFSVQCCQHMHEKAHHPSHWQISQGSVLDKPFISQFKDFDIIYSWGVLHHTGRMWEAIQNAAELVKPGGVFYIAIYNKVEGPIGSEFWLRIKKIYNFGPKFLRPVLEFLYTAALVSREIVMRRNPVKYVKNYQQDRGMSLDTDVKDWLGGYPYEFATSQEIIDFMKKHFPAYVLTNTKTCASIGNNWFLFKRP